MKYYLGVDVETTGQFLTKNAMIGIGCSVLNEDFEELDSFVTFLSVPEDRSWEQRCVDEFWSKNQTTLDIIKAEMKDPKKEMNRFATWLDDVDLKYGSDLVVLSDNVGYDCSWIDTYLSLFTERPCIYYRLKSFDEETKEKTYSYRRIWCTNSMYHGVLTETRPNEYVQWSLEKELGNQNNKWENDHNPLNDARNIAANYILYRQQAKKRKRE